MTYSLLIIFTDGSEKVIEGVKDFGITDMKVFYFIKNGYRAFVPKENVRYFGREFDWKGRN